MILYSVNNIAPICFNSISFTEILQNFTMHTLHTIVQLNFNKTNTNQADRA